MEPTESIATQNVRQFHIKHNFAVGESLSEAEAVPAAQQAGVKLSRFAILVNTLAQQLCNGTIASHIDASPDTFDLRLLRAHLILEEAAEVIDAMANLDEVRLLDGLADLDYVTRGTAVAYNLPIDAAHVEVHRSNMTKARRVLTGEDVRLRNKGSSYEPPDLKAVLNQHRTKG